MGSDRAILSTRPDDDVGTDGPDRWLRLISQGVIALLVGAALFGFLGLRTATAVATSGGITLEVLHPEVTRPGIATPFAISVATVDGSPLPETVMTRVESAFLDMFDENGLDPTPVSTFQDDRWIWWTFEVPDGASRLTVSFDARLQPTVQSGRTTVVAVEVQGEEAVSLGFHTRVVP